MRNFISRFLLRLARNYAARHGKLVISAETLSAIEDEASSLMQYCQRSGFIRNLKTGAGYKAERRIKNHAAGLYVHATAGRVHHANI